MLTSQTLRVVARRGVQVSHRSLSTTAAVNKSEAIKPEETQISTAKRDKWHPKTGVHHLINETMRETKTLKNLKTNSRNHIFIQVHTSLSCIVHQTV